MRWWLLLATACGRVGFDPGDGSNPADGDGWDPDGLVQDTTSDGSETMSTCVDPGNGETFATGTMPCIPWGTLAVDGTPAVVQMGGVIAMTPRSNVQGDAATCTRSGVPFANGVFLEVNAALNNNAGTQTFLQIKDAVTTSNSWSVFANAGSGMLRPSDSAIAAQNGPPYDPVAQRFWRIRPVSGTVVFEASPDASAWTQIAVSTVPPATTVNISFGVLVVPQVATPGTARFGSINTCP